MTDYEKWKAGYDASIEQRKAAGEISFQVFRNVNDSNTVTVLSVQKSAEKVQAFMESPDLKARMEAAGITKMGQMLIMEESYNGTHSYRYLYHQGEVEEGSSTKSA